MRLFALIVFSLLGLALLAPAPGAAATPPLVCTTVDFAGALDWDATDHGLPHMAGYYVRQLAGEYDMLEIRYRISGGNTALFGLVGPSYDLLQTDLQYVFRNNGGDAVFEYCVPQAPTNTPTSTATSAPAPTSAPTSTATSTATSAPAPTSAPATATATSTPNTAAIPMVTFNAPPVAPLDASAMLPAMNQIAGAVVDMSATPIGMFALALIGLGSLFEGLWFMLAQR